MNQQCKVCGEPAAGFHFGAFTCEGCKSFFGRSYNNLNSITECKNNGECIINKKNRTACKSCRLRKCLLVGMSKSGSRYGRRSNWFKIHCLLQEQQQAAVAQMKGKTSSATSLENPLPLLSPLAFPHPNLGTFLRPNNSSSPSVSSPDSDSSEPGLYSPRLNGTTNPFVNKDLYLSVPFHSMFMQPPSMSSPFLFPPSLLPFPVPPAKHNEYSSRLSSSPDHVQSVHKRIPTPDDPDEDAPRSESPPSRHSPTNNNDYSSKCNNKHDSDESFKSKCISDFNHNNNSINNNNNDGEDGRVTVKSKRFYLDAILGLKTASDKSGEEDFGEEQDNPIDLSLKGTTFKSEVIVDDDDCCQSPGEPIDQKIQAKIYNGHDEMKPIPLDLSV